MSWTPREGDSVREFEFSPLDPGAALTVRITGKAALTWPNPGNPAFVGLLGVYVGGRLVGGVQIICAKNKLKLDLGSAGRPHTAGVEIKGKDGSFKPGQSFDLELRLQDGGEGSVAGLAAKMPRALSGGGVTVRVGQDGVADGAYFPPVGWRIDSVQVDGEEMLEGEGEPDTGGGGTVPADELGEHLAEIRRRLDLIERIARGR